MFQTKKRLERQLFCLHQNEKSLVQLDSKRKDRCKEMEAIDAKKETVEDISRERNEECVRLRCDLAKIEHEMRLIEVSITKRKPTFIKVLGGVAHFRQKLEAAEKTYSRAQLAEDKHQRNIQELQDELDKIEKMKIAFEASISTEVQKPSADVRLEEAQVHFL